MLCVTVIVHTNPQILEFDFTAQLPSNVLEFQRLLLNVFETDFHVFNAALVVAL